MASAMVCCHRSRSRPCLYTSSWLCSHCHPSCNPPCPYRSSGPGKRAYPTWPCPTAAKRPASRLKLPLGSWRRTSRSLARRLRRRLLLLSLSLGPFCLFFARPHSGTTPPEVDQICTESHCGIRASVTALSKYALGRKAETFTAALAFAGVLAFTGVFVALLLSCL